MAEQVTIKGQKYTIVQRHTWGILPALDRDMTARNLSDSLGMVKAGGGKVLFHVHVGNSGNYSKVTRLG